MKKMKHDKPKGQWKKLVKKTAALIAAAVVLASTEGVTGIWTRPVVTAEAAETHKLGNSVTNQLLGGSSVEFDGRIYFSSCIDKGNPNIYPCIYSVKKDGTQKKLVLADESLSVYNNVSFDSLMVCDGYIFAIYHGGLIRVKPDGTEYKNWKTDELIINIAAADGKIYYEEKGIYSMNPDGTNTKHLLKKDVSLQAVDGKHIYYIDGKSLFRCDMNGKNRKKLITDKDYLQMYGLSGEKIYYRSYYNDNIYRLDMRTGKKKKICTLKSFADNGFTYNGNLYMTDVSARRWTKVDLKTGKKTTVWSGIDTILGIHDDVMIYKAKGKNKDKIVLATLKGKKLKTVNLYKHINWDDYMS